ncbi:hypothetical protein [Devosia sp. 1635]|uniref:glycine-rich domain-containing protein n=1 Tax=Devosia sp. 1635 TaxID=2726066 RepID=UPI00156459C7|nr:hypothetical protein [Devosia sp. 1635]
MTLPSPANDFLVSNDTLLDPPTLTAVFQGLWFRIKALQEIAAGFEDAVSQSAIDLATGKLDLAVKPALDTLNARVVEITGLMSDAEDRLAALQNGGVAAENVPLGPIEGFPANSNAAQAFALVSNALSGLGEVLSELTPLAEGAQQRDQKNQPNGYAGLAADGLLALAVRSSKVVRQVFTTSSNFLKEADDIGYHVLVIGGGQGGYNGQTGSTSSARAGGAGGGWTEAFFLPSDLAASTPVVVGAGGAPMWGEGGNSSFGSLLLALGGNTFANLSGTYNTNSLSSMVQASVLGMVPFYEGQDGRGGRYTASGGGSPSGASATGRSGGLPGIVIGGGAPGGAPGFAGAHANVPGGGGGAGGAGGGNGGDGMAPGGGGGCGGNSSGTGGTAGNGARGEVRVTRFKR